MRRDKDRLLLIAQVVEQIPDLLAMHGIQPGRRFIKEQHGGSWTSAQPNASSCRIPPDRLPAGTSRLRSRSVRPQSLDLRAQLLVRNPVGAAEKQHVFLHGQIGIKAKALCDIAEHRPNQVPMLPDVLALDDQSRRCSVWSIRTASGSWSFSPPRWLRGTQRWFPARLTRRDV